jgi:hypothetical protein
MKMPSASDINRIMIELYALENLIYWSEAYNSDLEMRELLEEKFRQLREYHVKLREDLDRMLFDEGESKCQKCGN